MGTIIFWFFVLCVAIALFQRIWPFLVLGGGIWLIYLFPVPAISIIAILAALGYWTESSSNKDLVIITQYLEEKGIVEFREIVNDTSINETSVNTALKKLIEKNKVKEVELEKGKLLYQSHNYKEVCKTTEIELD